VRPQLEAGASLWLPMYRGKAAVSFPMAMYIREVFILKLFFEIEGNQSLAT
jgi:hypothetical protein